MEWKTRFELATSSLARRLAKTNQLSAMLASAVLALAFTPFLYKDEITMRAIAAHITSTMQNTSQLVRASNATAQF